MEQARSAAITDAEGLGFVLRDARLQSGLTQSALASRLNLHQSYVAELEAGKSVKAIERLFEFANEVGLVIRAEYPGD